MALIAAMLSCSKADKQQSEPLFLNLPATTLLEWVENMSTDRKIAWKFIPCFALPTEQAWKCQAMTMISESKRAF
ncbi:hypothetical protein [Dyadobacter psychrotolerans]|uniref:Uncharacterized protein n=1 Tax=Dyadobacter psychrotolerans TaxID=2541721 RepID=A0A4R5DJ69_9BACT|nr:hypothetical protein [Dyadobacter psychrotolerans]TDE10845.1 hypothetical protein E0F88_27625 [Dyadobacter psychrotolerans]